LPKHNYTIQIIFEIEPSSDNDKKTRYLRMLASCWSNVLMSSSCPYSAAMCSAVFPSWSAAWTSAPVFNIMTSGITHNRQNRCEKLVHVFYCPEAIHCCQANAVKTLPYYVKNNDLSLPTFKYNIRTFFVSTNPLTESWWINPTYWLSVTSIQTRNKTIYYL